MRPVARILPEWEWPRIAETGCVVDQRWRELATRGCVAVVERGHAIVATAFVFLVNDEPRVDGLWIRAEDRGKVSILRPLYRALRFAVEQLGGSRVPIDAAVWMTRPERRAHGVEL